MTLTIEDITDILSGHRKDPRFKASLEYDGHEKIVFASDPETGFKAFIGVHNTARGVALGGCRYWSRYSDDNEAITDVLRLSRGMTYKNSMAGLPLGGGKTVIVGKPGTRQPSAETMKTLGKALESLGGIYVTAEDVGISVSHMLVVRGQTSYVAGLPLAALCEEYMPKGLQPDEIPDADPSPYTASGTFAAIKASAKYKLGVDTLKGLKVSVKGYGHVAQTLCRYLVDDGAVLMISDIDSERRRAIAKEFGQRSLLPEGQDIMSVDADIYVPCALGGDIHDESIGLLSKAGVKIVAGCANNQLKEQRHAEALRRAGILYAPDYVVNAGGVIAAGLQYVWMANPTASVMPTHKEIIHRVGHIYATLEEIFRRADGAGRDTAAVANEMAREGFEGKKRLAA